MPFVSSAATLRDGFAKPIVQALFWASCLLSVVSFYTTQMGMALYLSSWFSIMAALGVQLSLVLVAWLIGFARGNKALLIVVYAITALVSIAFSYVSLYTWFSAKERPVQQERALYDELSAAGARASQLLAQAATNGQRYVTALEEMTAAEKSNGSISRGRDGDPYLDEIREAVAREAQSYNSAYKEGAGQGVRYTAFERYTKLTQQSLAEVQAARQRLEQHRAEMKPQTSAEAQLRQAHQVYDSIPWGTVEKFLNRTNLERPTLPAYSQYAEQSGSAQEDLMRAFEELFRNPTPRHVFSLTLAAFIDVIVFLLAFSAGPYFYGDPEQRWYAAAAAIDGLDQQVLVSSLLRKMQAGRQGMPRVNASELSPGEQQFCLLLVSKGVATLEEHDTGSWYLFEASIHEKMLESLSHPGMAFRAAASRAAV